MRQAPNSPPPSPDTSDRHRGRLARGASGLAVATLVVGTVLAAPPLLSAEAAAVQQIDFQNAAPTTWTVPAGVRQIQLFVAGGGGGGSTTALGTPPPQGGPGQTITAFLDVTPGEELVFQVGQPGTAGTSSGNPGSGGAGWRRGGDGNTGSLSGRAGGGGGGASAVLRDGEPLIVAAGGGGAGGRGILEGPFGGDGGAGGFPGQNGEGQGNNGGGLPGVIPGGNGEQGDDAGTSSSGGGGGGGGGGLLGGARGGGGGAGGGGGGGGGGGSSFTAPNVMMPTLGSFAPEFAGIISVAFTPAFETTTTIIPPADEAVIGAPITIDVRVDSTQPGILPTGDVSLFDGDRLLGTLPLTGGVAVFTDVSIGLGERMLFAEYRPVTADTDPADLFPSVGERMITGLPVETITTLGLSTSSTAAGEAVTLTADVSIAGLGETPLTGLVEFVADGDVVATVPLPNTRRATATFIDPLPGQRSLSARYSGADESLPSESAPSALLVNAQPTSVSIQAPTAALQEGEEIVLFARIDRSAASTAPLMGTVQFELDGVPLGSPQLVVNGQARFAVPSAQIGVRTATAAYSGDAVNGPSVSDPLSIRVQPRVAAPALNAPTLSGPPRSQGAGVPALRGPSSLPATGAADGSGVAALMVLLLTAGVALRASARLRPTSRG